MIISNIGLCQTFLIELCPFSAENKNLEDHGGISGARKVDSILKWAQDAGMRTGFVTDMAVTHATPAALYAHSTER